MNGKQRFSAVPLAIIHTIILDFLNEFFQKSILFGAWHLFIGYAIDKPVQIIYFFCIINSLNFGGFQFFDFALQLLNAVRVHGFSFEKFLLGVCPVIGFP